MRRIIGNPPLFLPSLLGRGGGGSKHQPSPNPSLKGRGKNLSKKTRRLRRLLRTAAARLHRGSGPATPRGRHRSIPSADWASATGAGGEAVAGRGPACAMPADMPEPVGHRPPNEPTATVRHL